MPGATGHSGSVPPCVLDITRLAGRLPDRVLTGVDRVELAWLRDLLERGGPLWCLARSAFGHILLDRSGARQLLSRIEGREGWGKPDLLSRLALRTPPSRRLVESKLRRLCCARAARPGLQRLLKRHVPAGALYLNLGHANLTPQTLGDVRRAGMQVVVLIHDVIPLTHPELVRAGTSEGFRRKLAAAAAGSDLVIHSAEATRTATEREMRTLGRVPAGVTAALGVTLTPPDPQALPEKIAALDRPFLCVGTLEPRKNQVMLVEIWERLAGELPGDALPPLVLAGARGWLSPADMVRIERSPLMGNRILLAEGLSDGALAALYSRARGLLMPSLCEGYGFPPLEAAALGCPVIAGDLPVYRETLGAFGVYLDPVDMYSWQAIIKQNLAGIATEPKAKRLDPPRWADHVSSVLKAANRFERRDP